MVLNARRLLLVVPVWLLASVVSVLVIDAVDGRHGGLGFLTGLQFVLALAPPLIVLDRWRGLNVPPSVAASVALLISLSLPALLFGAVLLGGFLFSALEAARVRIPVEIQNILLTMTASALGARLVAAALRKLTGRPERSLCWAMVVWGTCWPLLQVRLLQLWDVVAFRWLFPGGLGWRNLVSVQSWQIPIGLACVIWFLRAAPASTPRAAASAT
jgi:hypothetical protein